MNKLDSEIRKALMENMQTINDSLFTKRVVETHLSKKIVGIKKPFFNFMSLILGASSIIISAVLIIIYKYQPLLFQDIDFNEETGMVILFISLVFSIYKLIEEITAPNILYK